MCTHPPLGVTGYYINVVRHLDSSRPVYGIQSPAFCGLRDPFDRMEEMAAYYIDAMRTVQPQGPYLLAGHSSAAYIAYEMALQLEGQGEQVPLLAVIDSAAPYGPEGEIMEAFKSSDLYESVEALFVCA